MRSVGAPERSGAARHPEAEVRDRLRPDRDLGHRCGGAQVKRSFCRMVPWKVPVHQVRRPRRSSCAASARLGSSARPSPSARPSGPTTRIPVVRAADLHGVRAHASRAAPVCAGLRKLTLNDVRGPPVPGLTWTLTGVTVCTGIAAATGTAATAANATMAMSTMRLIGRRRYPREAGPVTLHLRPPGRLAQLGERRLDKAEVAGSSPASSTPVGIGDSPTSGREVPDGGY